MVEAAAKGKGGMTVGDELIVELTDAVVSSTQRLEGVNAAVEDINAVVDKAVRGRQAQLQKKRQLFYYR